jgi:hypothetical protein
MGPRPARGVVLCLTSVSRVTRATSPVTTENIAYHIKCGIAFGPSEVSMWHSPRSIAQISQQCGYPVCHSRAFRAQHLMGSYFPTAHVQISRKLTRIISGASSSPMHKIRVDSDN